MINQAWSKRLVIVALPIIVAVFYFTAVIHFSYTPDDTYIYLRFAKNLIGGNGISFNPGVPTYGFTSPLWLFIISLGGAMGIDLYVAAKALDLVFASFALIVFYFLSYGLIRDVAVAICATVAFSVNAWLMRWAGTGMETSLSVLLMLAVFLFCFRNEYFVAVVLTALLSLVRPEAALIVPIILLDVYLNSLNKKRALNLAAALLLIYVAMIVPWLAYAHYTFGTMLPNTALAKAGFHPGVKELLATGVDIVKTIGVTEGIAVLTLIVSGIVLFTKREKLKGEGNPDRDQTFFLFRQGIIGIGWIFLLPFFYLVTDVNIVSRYLLLVTPIMTILAFSLLYYSMKLSAVKRFVNGGILLLTMLVMMQNQIVYRLIVAPGIAAFEQGMDNCLIPIGKWLNQNTSPGTKVVTGDVGAIGYFSEREICDAAGLLTPDAHQVLRQGNTGDEIIEKKLYKTFCQPDYVIHRAPEPDQLKNDPELLPLLSRPFLGLSLSDQRITYYTLYQVKKISDE